MTNTKIDLKREVAQRLRDTLHGEEIDILEDGRPEIPHMLGVVPIGAISTDKVERNTILDHNHEFWTEYETDIKTKNAVSGEIEDVMHELKADGIFIVDTHEEDEYILYPKVQRIEKLERTRTDCAECGNRIEASPSLELNCGRYYLTYNLSCNECGFSRKLETSVRRA